MIIDRNKLTPMMQQYFVVKDSYADSILMYRLGDFYEMFFDDAIIASKVLEIALTGRACGLEERAPMCGVPFHSVDSYINKLVGRGYTVAICEQAEDPSEAKGLVRREVTRVITPGTIMDTAALDDRRNNYLCSYYLSKDDIGLSFVDITTGEVFSGCYSGMNVKNDVLSELIKFSPSEIIINHDGYKDTECIDALKRKINVFIREYHDYAFEAGNAEKRVIEQFGSVSETGLAGMKSAVSSLGALVQYLIDTQKTELSNLKKVEVLSEDGVMQIDMYSMRNLEITETIRERNTKGSLLSVLNKTKTSMGSRLMRKMIMSPLTNRISIQNRLYAVDELYNNPILREEIIEILRGISDIERTISRVTYNTANCHDLLSLKKSFERLPELENCLKQCQSKLLKSQLDSFSSLKDLYILINSTIDENAPVTLRNGNMIKYGANDELDRTRQIRDDGSKWLRDMVEREKENSGIKTMKLGYNKVFGYYIEVSKLNSGSVPEHFIRKQTLVNAERYITPDMKKLEDDILNADFKVTDMEYRIFSEVRDKVAAKYDEVRKTAAVIAMVDVLCSLASVAEKNGYVMPEVNNSNKIIIKNGRHPVVEAINKSNVFIPNDTLLDNEENQIAVITGPNMAGKSTYMRQVAVIVLMAQMGSFVPAASAEIGVVDKIFTRVGASDDLNSGDSTFMVEMKEVAYILDNATENSLIILDEIGRGTSTFDGLSIAWAVVEYIADVKKCGAKTLFATHYHELTELEDMIDNVKNYCIAVKKNGDNITFLRKIIPGGADESYGVEVAALAGVKKTIIKRAKEIAEILESRDKKRINTIDIKTNHIEKMPSNGFDEQVDFLGLDDNEIISELKQMDLNMVTPVEALTKLFELQAKAKRM